jgi:PHP family Zn ribbon phosphoesterase
MRVVVDLHNHSCLSPCASDTLLPSLLALEAAERSIGIIGLTDHNATQNLVAFAQACELCSVMGVYGIEVTTVEEVHLVLLFERVADAHDFGLFVQSTLPKVPNTPSHFGNQLVVDVGGAVVDRFDLMLAGASSLSFDELVHLGLERGALVIPAHIDRPANSVLSHLGFLPDLPYSAVEMVKPTEQQWTVITASDAHYLDDVGRSSCVLEMEEISWEALKASLADNLIVR